MKNTFACLINGKTTNKNYKNYSSGKEKRKMYRKFVSCSKANPEKQQTNTGNNKGNCKH